MKPYVPPAVEREQLEGWARNAALIIHRAFASYADRFRGLTQRALGRFEKREWAEVVTEARERLGLYRAAVEEAEQSLREVIDDARQPEVWVDIKASYARRLGEAYDRDLAQTFFNSVSRRFLYGGVSAVKFETRDAPEGDDREIQRSYSGPLEESVRRILDDFDLKAPWEDRERDIRRISDRVREFLTDVLLSERHDRLEVLPRLFFRNKAVFVIGRVLIDRVVIPLVLQLRHGERGVYVHSVLLEEAKAGRLFSNTRSNFHVATERHRALIGFLKSIFPGKHEFEFYAGIGHFHHARSKLYDELFRHLEESGERFQSAPGARGKVMIVFSLPGFPMVFKVIRDRPEPPKTVTRRDVITRYQFVRLADRAGRMLDALTFGDMQFHRDQFDAAILQELLAEAPSTVVAEGDRISIRHLYAQRQVTPLPEFFRTEKNLRHHRDAIIDLGYLIKDLATVNIFLGDYLLKNFGITSYGRVVSYDYDELDLLTSQNFRAWPTARNEEEEFLGGHVESMVVADTDVFPVEFERLLGIPRYLMPAFESVHADLFGPEYYRDIQARLRADEVIDITSAGISDIQV